MSSSCFWWRVTQIFNHIFFFFNSFLNSHFMISDYFQNFFETKIILYSRMLFLLAVCTVSFRIEYKEITKYYAHVAICLYSTDNCNNISELLDFHSLFWFLVGFRGHFWESLNCLYTAYSKTLNRKKDNTEIGLSI